MFVPSPFLINSFSSFLLISWRRVPLDRRFFLQPYFAGRAVHFCHCGARIFVKSSLVRGGGGGEILCRVGHALYQR